MADETPKPDPTLIPRKRKNRDAPLEGSAVEVPAQDVSVPVDTAAASPAEAQPLPEALPSSEPEVIAPETKAESEPQKTATSGPGLVLVLILMLAGGLGGAAGLYVSLLNGLLPLPAAQETNLAALEKTVASLAAKPADAGLASRLEAAEGRIKALEQKPAAAPPPDLAPLRAEMAALKQQMTASPAAQGQAAPPVADPNQQAALEERLKTGEAEVKALTIRLTQIDAEIASLGAAVRDASGQRAALTQKLGQLDEKTAKSNTVGNKAALALAISTMRNTLDNGQSFVNEYRALRALAGDDPDLKTLEAAAKTGIPTSSVLRQRFRTLLPQLVKAIPSSQAEGWLAKAKQSLEGLISIRQVGEASGNDPQAVLARIDALLQRNDLAKVLEEFTRLPEPVQQAGKEWNALVVSRVAAETLMNTMARSALQALAEPPK